MVDNNEICVKNKWIQKMKKRSERKLVVGNKMILEGEKKRKKQTKFEKKVNKCIKRKERRRERKKKKRDEEKEFAKT